MRRIAAAPTYLGSLFERTRRGVSAPTPHIKVST